jgi:hypothetical protein
MKHWKDTYDEVGDFSEGRARVRRKKHGFVDTEGNEVIPLKYDDVGSFKEGRTSIWVAKVKFRW